MRILLVISGGIALLLTFRFLVTNIIDIDDVMHPEEALMPTPLPPVLIAWGITGILWLISSKTGASLDGTIRVLDILLFPFAWLLDVILKGGVWLFGKLSWFFLHPIKTFGMFMIGCFAMIAISAVVGLIATIVKKISGKN